MPSHESLSSRWTLTEGVGDNSARVRSICTQYLTNRTVDQALAKLVLRIIHEPRSPLPTVTYFAPIADFNCEGINAVSRIGKGHAD